MQLMPGPILEEPELGLGAYLTYTTWPAYAFAP